MAASTLKPFASSTTRNLIHRQTSSILYILSKKQHTSVVEEPAISYPPSPSPTPRTRTAPGTGPRVLTSPYPSIELHQVNFCDFVLNGVDRFSNNTALQCGMTGRSYTYGILDSLIRRLGAALSRKGFGKGDVLAMVCPNIPEFVLGFMATTAIGGIVTTVNPIYTVDEIARQLKDSNAMFALTIPFCSENVVNAAAKCPNVKEVFVLGEAPGCTPAMAMLAEADEKYFPTNVKINPLEDLLALPYSSGTTGPPKGVMLSHYNVCSNILQTVPVTRPITEDDTILAVLPFFHIYALTTIMGKGLFSKLKIVTLPKFEPEMYINALREHRPTILHVVPPMISFFAKSPLIRNSDFDSVDSIFCGAAPLSTSMCHSFLERICPHTLSFQEGFGMTETSPVTHMNPKEDARIGTCGLLVPNTEAKIIDVDTGKLLGPLEPGEICVRGPQVMKGYFKKPEDTKNTIDSEGWLHTGDIGIYDDDEFFKVIDRLKELIKVKGLQVSPSELEDILMGHPGIQDAAVVGVPDSRSGELPKAFIVKKNPSLTEDEVSDFIEKQVAPHKALKGGVQFIDAIPKTQTGKILHRTLRAQYVMASVSAEST